MKRKYPSRGTDHWIDNPVADWVIEKFGSTVKLASSWNEAHLLGHLRRPITRQAIHLWIVNATIPPTAHVDVIVLLRLRGDKATTAEQIAAL